MSHNSYSKLVDNICIVNLWFRKIKVLCLSAYAQRTACLGPELKMLEERERSVLPFSHINFGASLTAWNSLVSLYYLLALL